MAPATLPRARSIAFRLAPEEQVALLHEIVSRVAHLPKKMRAKASMVQAKGVVRKLAKAIGAPLNGKDLDARLKNAVSRKERGVPALAAIAATRKRLGL